MAVTTIPWRDGSGDNIYLTYSSASGNQTVQVTSDANMGVARAMTVYFSTGNISRQLVVEQEAAELGTRLQYIGTNGNQYFDTGVNPKNTQNFEFDAWVLFSTGGACVWGARDYVVTGSAQRAKYTLSVYMNGDGKLAINDVSYDSGYLTSYATVYNERHLIKITNRTLYVDTTSYRATGKTNTYNYSDVTIGLLKMRGTSNSWQTGSNRNIAARIYGFKIYDGNTLVRDFVPYLDENNVVCLFDSASNSKLLPLGTGSLVAGPAIGVTVPYITEADITSDMLRYYKSNTGATRTCIPIVITNVNSFLGTIKNNSSTLRIAAQLWDSEQTAPGTSSSNPPTITSTHTVWDSNWIDNGGVTTFSYAHDKSVSKGTAQSTSSPYSAVIVATYADGTTGTPTYSEIVNAIDLYFEI